LTQSIPHLTAEQIAALSPADREEFEEALEAVYWEAGREKFGEYVGKVDVPGTPASDDDTFFPERLKASAHHRLIIEAIQGLADDRDKELARRKAGEPELVDDQTVDGIMAFMPPGAAKSTYLSVLGASWLLGRRPGTNVIGCSYGQDLANRFGRRVRTIARSPEYSKIMGCSITGDNQAVDNWSLTNGSDYRAAGIGAGITGFRADYALIDDPVKGREEADSETIRAKVWDGYKDDIETRLKPGGKIIICMTRWHEDDLAGRILGESWKGESGVWRGTDGRLWRVINLPLLSEYADDPLGRSKGELLWPEWFKMKDAERLRTSAKKGGTFARTWSSLYQQRPAPDEGAILSRRYWQEWPHRDLPDVKAIYLAYDTAFEEDEEADCSAMVAWGVFEHTSKQKDGSEYRHDHVIMLGAWQDKVNAVDLIDIVGQHCSLFTPDLILVEKRASGIQLIQEMKRRRYPVKAWLPKGKVGTKGKIPRAHAVATMLEQGSVWYVPGTKANMVMDQCAAFPYGVHDDLVDCVTMSLSYFRDRFIFKTPSDERSLEEIREEMAEDAEARRLTKRSLYGGKIRKRDELTPGEFDDMTEKTQRKLYN
jgi:hypothetical protein